MAPDYGVPIRSEMMEPFGSKIVSRMFARCEAVKQDRHQFEDACCALWMVVESLNTIGVAVGTAVHFTVAAGNHQSQIARYIRDELGVDPFETWSKGREPID